MSDPKLLPITIGVFGDWGNGKTSIMKMLQKQLNSHEDIAVLYFDAWLFEGYDDAKSALISSVLKQLTSHKRFPEALKDDARKLIGRVNWMRVLKMGWDNVALPAVLAYATGGATAVPGFLEALKGTLVGRSTAGEAPQSGESVLNAQKAGELLKDVVEPDLGDVRSFREGFGGLLKKTPFKTLVVLIDDLDRCSPERIVENLEAIKLFLNVEKTAFIIGADPRIVRHAVAVRYRDALDAARLSAAPGESGNEAGDQLVKDYVEKLIQVPYHLPRLSPAEIETYMTLLFAQRDLESADFHACIAACEVRRQGNRFGSFGLADVQEALKGKTLPDALKAALSFSAGAAQLITENLKGNPRQVKRFMNAFVLRRRLASVAKMQMLRDDVLLKLMLLEYSNEARFRELARWHEEQRQTPKEIVEMEAGKEPSKDWDKDALRRWIQMERRLSAVDLSVYFRLVLDRRATSLLRLSL
ncbi:MAG: P-loop NTPase fold protein, partial [bacterium]